MKKLIQSIILVLVFLCGARLEALTKENILEKRITIKLQDKRISTILNIISETNQFYFSYDPTKVETSKTKSIHAINKSVKEVLNTLFNNTVSFQQISNHIILKPKPITKEPKVRKNKPTIYYYQISGYITDEISGLGINGISVYEKTKLTYSTSEDFGFYELKFTSKSAEEKIYFASPLIKDTFIVTKGTESPERKDLSFQLAYKGRSLSPIPLNNTELDSPQLEPLTIEVDTLENFKALLKQQVSKVNNLGLGQKIVKGGQNLLDLNVNDSFTRIAQVSFLTPIGTNGKMSSKVGNKFSLNVIAGYHRSCMAIEIGGVANVLTHHVQGFQAAGFGNYVGGNVSGLQIAGFSNHNSGSLNGASISGFYNYQKEEAKGTLIAGFANWNQSNVNGAQIAGFMNKATDISGVQIAGFLNKAKTVKGAQIGFINISDTMKGVPIGLINIVKQGLHQLEVSTNYANDVSLLFRTGAEKLYTIIGLRSAGINFNEQPWLGVEYGIGSNIKLAKPLYINAELTAYQPTKNFRYDYLRLNNQFRINLEYRPFKKVALFAGSGFAVNVFSRNDPNINILSNKFGNSYSLSSQSNTQVSMNPTWQFGVRFF
jgi:hypothetical protein